MRKIVTSLLLSYEICGETIVANPYSFQLFTPHAIEEFFFALFSACFFVCFSFKCCNHFQLTNMNFTLTMHKSTDDITLLFYHFLFKKKKEFIWLRQDLTFNWWPGFCWRNRWIKISRQLYSYQNHLNGNRMDSRFESIALFCL